MGNDYTERLKVSFQLFQQCLDEKKMFHNSWPIALVGAGVGAAVGKLPGAAVGAVIGFDAAALPIAWDCTKRVSNIEPPPPLKREPVPDIQASR